MSEKSHMEIKAFLLEAVIKAFPYPDSITNIDFESEHTAIRFMWCEDSFRVASNLLVEEVDDELLKNSNLAMLAHALIKSAVAAMDGAHDVPGLTGIE